VTEKFSHIAEDGSVWMVDVSSKPISKRVATAEAVIGLRPGDDRKNRLQSGGKRERLGDRPNRGDPGSQTNWELIPLCHPLPVHHVQVEFENRPDEIRIERKVTSAAQTGVEMEALTGCHHRRVDDL
jgi:cyclic pyranopterin monophosphate synthase